MKGEMRSELNRAGIIGSVRKSYPLERTAIGPDGKELGFKLSTLKPTDLVMCLIEDIIRHPRCISSKRESCAVLHRSISDRDGITDRSCGHQPTRWRTSGVLALVEWRRWIRMHSGTDQHIGTRPTHRGMSEIRVALVSNTYGGIDDHEDNVVGAVLGLFKQWPTVH
jgi:hypothetical protein